MTPIALLHRRNIGSILGQIASAKQKDTKRSRALRAWFDLSHLTRGYVT
jgi:hypothetical protein